MGENQTENAARENERRICPKCGSTDVVLVERHPDTSFNHMALRCRDCGYEKEV